MTEIPDSWSDFIPSTCEREIAPNVVFRPIRSWSSLTYAGEGLREVNGDGSGCVGSNEKCYPPRTVTHRCYWNKLTKTRLSAFLSYPGAMGSFGHGMGDKQYFWEIYYLGEIERFAEETEMEQRIIEVLK